MNKIRVILIEDDDLTRIALRTAVSERSDIEWIGEAINGIEGLKLLYETLPDIAIVDIGLPDIDGIELTKQFRASSAGAKKSSTKILILTLHDQQEDVIAAFAAGADSYCMKDIKLELLIEALQATHEGNVWIDPAIARLVVSQIQSHLPENSKTKTLLADNPLTDRELEVLQLIVNGCSNAEIAERLFITVGTVKTHVRNILNKLCADDRTQAAVHALRTGLVG